MCSLGDKTYPIFIRVLCVITNGFFLVGAEVLTWPETPPLLGHHHEVHHFYKSEEPVLGDRTWLQLVNTSPLHLHRIVLIREQKNIFRKLAVNYQQIQCSLTRMSTHQVQGRKQYALVSFTRTDMQAMNTITFQGSFSVVISPDSKWEQIASSLIWWVTCR